MDLLPPCGRQGSDDSPHDDGSAGLRVWGLGFGVWGLGFQGQGLRFKV